MAVVGPKRLRGSWRRSWSWSRSERCSGSYAESEFGSCGESWSESWSESESGSKSWCGDWSRGWSWSAGWSRTCGEVHVDAVSAILT